MNSITVVTTPVDFITLKTNTMKTDAKIARICFAT